MLERKGRLVLGKNCWNWVEDALSLPGLRLISLSAQTALESCFLPGKFHDDPADRLIVATARLEDAAIVTRDKQILKYADHGHVSVIRC
jgi:PIN domain nuclease of toxin-antitoxin system